MNPSVLAKRIKNLRIDLDLSQDAVAEMAQLSSRAVISRYENEKVIPDLVSLIKVANVLNTTVAYLIGETDNARKKK